MEKLARLVRVDDDGNCALTDDGRETLRLVASLESSKSGSGRANGNRHSNNNYLVWVLGALLALSIAITAVAIINTNGIGAKMEHMN
jgi:predicted outer membrane lipoprotein